MRPQARALRVSSALAAQQHVVELQVAVRHPVRVHRAKSTDNTGQRSVHERTVTGKRLRDHALAQIIVFAQRHRQAVPLRPTVVVASVHGQDVVVPRQSLVEADLRLRRARLVEHLRRDVLLLA